MLLVNFKSYALVLNHENRHDLFIVIIYELFWLIAKITNNLLAPFTHLALFLDVFISFHRLGSLLSDHLVNDTHLRKGNREHKELLIACKVCSPSVVSVAHIWIVNCVLCFYCDSRQRHFRFRLATLQFYKFEVKMYYFMVTRGKLGKNTTTPNSSRSYNFPITTEFRL